MSEEILKALMVLFAIISKQDTGSNERHRKFVSAFLTNQLSKLKVIEYLMLYDETLNTSDKKESKEGTKLTSVKDSVKILSICRKIIENHGGTIEVTSEVGTGTTFTIRFPLEGSIDL